MFTLFQKEFKFKNEIYPKGIASYILIFLAVLLITSIVSIPFLFITLDFSELVQNGDLSNAPASFTLLNLYLTIISSLMILWYATKKQKRSLNSLGLNKEKLVSHYLLGLCIGFVSLSLSLLILFLMGAASLKEIRFDGLFMVLLFFVGFIFQGFEEELMCRGFMMFGHTKTTSTFMAVMFNSIFFSLLHIGNNGFNGMSFVNIILAGMFFSLLAIYFDDIWVASGAHSMWNFAQGNLYGIAVSGLNAGSSIMRFELSGNAIISGGFFGIEASIATSIVLILCIILLCVSYKKKNLL